MSDEIKVNTSLVNAAANNIARSNESIRTAFESVEKGMKDLDYYWDGKACDNALTAFSSITNAFCEDRYNVINNYVNFLLKLIEEGYVEIEDINTELAKAFK